MCHIENYCSSRFEVKVPYFSSDVLDEYLRHVKLFIVGVIAGVIYVIVLELLVAQHAKF